MDLKIVEFIQKLSNPALDLIMRIITEFGDIYFYLAIGVVFYWLIDKKFGFKLMVVFLFSMTINGLIKGIVKRERPYQKGAKAILQQTDGYSFPSGHAQGIFSMSYLLHKDFKKHKWLNYVLLSLIILVPFSRVYLGQHYLSDVLVGAVVGIAFSILGLFLLEYKSSGNEEIRALYFIPVVFLLAFIVGANELFLASGAYSGLVIGYILEKKYVDYDIKDTLTVNILKIIIGVVVMLGLKEGLKILLGLFINNKDILDIIRYFFVTLWASFGSMALFKVLFKKEVVLKQSEI